MDAETYLARWSQLHSGADTTGLVGRWLTGVYRLAGPLSHSGITANGVTLTGLLIALAAIWPAASTGRWPLLAACLVAVSGLLDNVDGAVAVLTGQASSRGAVLDAVSDRLADIGYAIALWAAGAPGALAAAAAGIALLHEYLRARATVAGMSQIGVVTIAERPTRVIVTAMFLLGCGCYPAARAGWALAGGAALATVGAVGFVHLAFAVNRLLSAGSAPGYPSTMPHTPEPPDHEEPRR